MVELISSKKRKRTPQKTAEKASRYPPSFRFSGLTYKQAPELLALSPQNIIVSVPTQPNPNQFNTVAGDIYSLHTPIRKNPVKLVENYHKQHTITHLQWNQNGNAVASVDETGHLAVWHIQHSVQDWELTYNVDLKQPLAAFLWLNSDRQYTMQPDNTTKRAPIIGPRNPYGQLGFIAVTVHGEITVHYQRNASIFSSFSTPMPNIGRREISRVDAGCFGMSLAGLENWERISHAAMTIDNQGQIYLASHDASIQPKSIAIHSIKIKFPKKNAEKGAIECKPITSLKLHKQQNLLNVNHVTQLVFRKNVSPLELVIGLAEEDDEEEFTSFISSWQLKQQKQSIASNFGTISNDRTSLVYQSGTKIKNKFISCLKSSSTGELMVGFSDGSVHLEQQNTTLANKHQVESIDKSYWQVSEPHKTSDGCIDPIVDIVLSPNETHLLYLFSSTKLGISRITTDAFTEEYVTTMAAKLQLGLLNGVDSLDLISELVRMSKSEMYKAKVDTILNHVLKTYESHLNGSESSQTQVQKSLGFALAAYNRLPSKQIQAMNLSRAIQLPLILECFIGSCTTEYASITTILDKPVIDNNDKMEFDTNSLWSLVSLSTWIFDYLRWILREWNMFFNCKRPKDSNYGDLTDKATHAVLLIHKDSRMALCNTLKMIHHFIQYTSTNNYHLENMPESQALLQRYILTLQNDQVITIKDTIEFLNALNAVTPKSITTDNHWSILLSSKLTGYAIEEIQSVSNAYRDKCAKPSIYLEKHGLYKYDVVRKRRLPSDININHCIRCNQPTLPSNTINDPCYSAQWYQSIGKRCVCGGVFY